MTEHESVAGLRIEGYRVTTREIHRLQHGPEPAEKPAGITLAKLLVACPGNATVVHNNIQLLLSLILDLSARNRTDIRDWETALPTWFLAQCPPMPSQEEQDRHLQLLLEERFRLEQGQGWPLRAIMNGFLVLERYWSWWDATVVSADRLEVALDVDDWPFPSAALEWLLIACGATAVEKED